MKRPNDLSSNGVSVAPDVLPAQIVNENQDDVGALLGMQHIANCEKNDKTRQETEGTHVWVTRWLVDEIGAGGAAQ